MKPSWLNIFSKNSWFLFSDKSQVKKSGGVQAHSWNSIHFFSVLSSAKHLVCVCVFCLFTPSLSVLFVFHRKNLVFVPNVQIYGFYKWEIFKKKRHWKRNFWYQWIIQCNTDSCCEHMTDGVNIYLQRCASLLVWVCCVSLCVCVCVWYQNRVPAKNHTMCQTSVNLMPCCIECISRSLWYQGTKAPHLQIHNIIKWNNGMITHSVKEIRYQK